MPDHVLLLEDADPQSTFSGVCAEWIRGCSCAPADRPQDCKECTDAFLRAVLRIAERRGLEIGVNAP